MNNLNLSGQGLALGYLIPSNTNQNAYAFLNKSMQKDFAFTKLSIAQTQNWNNSQLSPILSVVKKQINTTATQLPQMMQNFNSYAGNISNQISSTNKADNKAMLSMYHSTMQSINNSTSSVMRAGTQGQNMAAQSQYGYTSRGGGNVGPGLPTQGGSFLCTATSDYFHESTPQWLIDMGIFAETYMRKNKKNNKELLHYYRIAPVLVAKLGTMADVEKHFIFVRLRNTMMDILEEIRNSKFAQAKNHYTIMVQNLAQELHTPENAHL